MLYMKKKNPIKNRDKLQTYLHTSHTFQIHYNTTCINKELKILIHTEEKNWQKNMFSINSSFTCKVFQLGPSRPAGVFSAVPGCCGTPAECHYTRIPSQTPPGDWTWLGLQQCPARKTIKCVTKTCVSPTEQQIPVQNNRMCK